MSMRRPGHEAHRGPVPTKEECLRAAAHVFLMAAIRIEQEQLDAISPDLDPPRNWERSSGSGAGRF